MPEDNSAPSADPEAEDNAPTAQSQPPEEAPSASPGTVQPFESAGAATKAPEHKSHAGKMILVIIAIIVIAVAAYLVLTAPKNTAVKSTGSTSPTVTPAAQDFPALYTDLSSSMGEADSSLTNADTGLNDKQGDLSE